MGFEKIKTELIRKIKYQGCCRRISDNYGITIRFIFYTQELIESYGKQVLYNTIDDVGYVVHEIEVDGEDM